MENNKKDESSSSSSSKMDANPNPNNNNNSENPNPNNNNNFENPNPGSRRPFTNLSQVDADLALARTLQDQERAYMMLRMNNNGGDVDDDDGSDDHESWETGSYVNDDEFDHHNSEEDDEEEEEEVDEDAFDIHAHLGSGGGAPPPPVVELDPASFSNDEAYARALQDAEDQEMAARLLALTGIHDMVTDNDLDDDDDDDDDDDVDDDHHHHHHQDTWDDVDPDELSYEELLALGEVVGTESRGLSADSIASLRSMTYKTQNTQNGSSETCVICRLDYDDGDNLILLSCKHSYHSDCITNWLQINKVCPVCNTEVSTSGAAS